MPRKQQPKQQLHGTTDAKYENLSVIGVTALQAYTSLISKLSASEEVRAKTPGRAAKALMDLCVPTPFKMSTFIEEGVDEMIIQNGIRIFSLCEHHMLPFFGTAAVAILPNGGRILGLSKFSRLVRYHAAGLNTQERITKAVGDALWTCKELDPAGVAVSLRCYHTCISMRGTRDTGAVTTTQFLAGAFKSDPSARAEFLNSVDHPPIC